MIKLEPIRKKHIPSLQKYALNPIIDATSNVPNEYPSNGAEFWYSVVEERVEENISKVCAINEEGNFCGVITLNSIDYNKKTAELDYWVAVEYQNKGIASKAVSLVTDEAKRCVGLTTLMSGCLTKNTASGGVLEKNKFNEIGSYGLKKGKFIGETMGRFKLKMHNNEFSNDSFEK